MAASISILGGYIINGSLITKTLTYVHIAIYFDRNFAQFLYNFLIFENAPTFKNVHRGCHDVFKPQNAKI